MTKTEKSGPHAFVLTIKQERFAQTYVETGNASEAYRRAYNAENMKPETINRKAMELLANGKITAYLAVLRTAHQKRHELTVDDLVAELEQARELAMRSATPAAAVAASMGKAKLLGLVVAKNEVTGRDGSPLMVAEPSNRELARVVAGILREAQIEGEALPALSDENYVVGEEIDAEADASQQANLLTPHQQHPAPQSAIERVEHEVRESGAEIVAIAEIQKYAVVGPDGTLHGYRRDIEEARELADRLAPVGSLGLAETTALDATKAQQRSKALPGAGSY